MRTSNKVLAGALCAGSLALTGCFLSSDLAAMVAWAYFASIVEPVFEGPSGAKPAALQPNYVVHYIELDDSTRTASLYAATQFLASTPLTFGYKQNKKQTRFKVDKKAPTPTAAAFVKERLEELSNETFTVNFTKVRGKAKRKIGTAFPVTILVSYAATVDTGALAGTAFPGKFKFTGDLAELR